MMGTCLCIATLSSDAYNEKENLAETLILEQIYGDSNWKTSRKGWRTSTVKAVKNLYEDKTKKIKQEMTESGDLIMNELIWNTEPYSNLDLK